MKWQIVPFMRLSELHQSTAVEIWISVIPENSAGYGWAFFQFHSSITKTSFWLNLHRKVYELTKTNDGKFLFQISRTSFAGEAWPPPEAFAADYR
jgi:hypothetical protein